MSEVPKVYIKLDTVPYVIGDNLPEVNFAPHPGKSDSLLSSTEGLRRQIDECRKQFPDRLEMKLYFMRYMTDEEVVAMESSDKSGHIDSDTFRDMVNNVIANSNTTKGL